MKKILLVALLLLVGSPLFAGEKTVNGVTTTTTSTVLAQLLSAPIFSAYDCDATMKYNDAGGVAITSGAIYVGEHTDSIVITLKVATLGSTGVDFHVEGIFGSDITSKETKFPYPQSTASWSDIDTQSFASTTATNYDFVWYIREKGLKWIRLGAQATGSVSTDSVSAWIRGVGDRDR